MSLDRAVFSRTENLRVTDLETACGGIKDFRFSTRTMTSTYTVGRTCLRRIHPEYLQSPDMRNPSPTVGRREHMTNRGSAVRLKIVAAARIGHNWQRFCHRCCRHWLEQCVSEWWTTELNEVHERPDIRVGFGEPGSEHHSFREQGDLHLSRVTVRPECLEHLKSRGVGAVSPDPLSHPRQYFFSFPEEDRCTRICYWPSPRPDMRISSAVIQLEGRHEFDLDHNAPRSARSRRRVDSRLIWVGARLIGDQGAALELGHE